MPHPKVYLVADTVVFRKSGDSLEVLLIKRGGEPFEGYWALPGGFVDPEEKIIDGARRELLEETGVSVEDLEVVGVYDDVKRDPRGRAISVAHWAMVEGEVPIKASDDASECKWFDVGELPELAFDHEEMIRVAKEKL